MDGSDNGVKLREENKSKIRQTLEEDRVLFELRVSSAFTCNLLLRSEGGEAGTRTGGTQPARSLGQFRFVVLSRRGLVLSHNVPALAKTMVNVTLDLL